MPPPGQQGRGSYVWVPDILNAEDNAGNEDQLDAENLFDDMAVEDNDGSTQTEEDFVDPYAVEIDDFSEDIDVDEAGIGKDNAALDVEKVT
jgi:hypothetical protein